MRDFNSTCKGWDPVNNNGGGPLSKHCIPGGPTYPLPYRHYGIYPGIRHASKKL